MDWVILVFIVCYMLVTFLSDLKLLLYYEHADDSSFAAPEIVCKITILGGLQLAWLVVLALPLDVYNNSAPLLPREEVLQGKRAGLDLQLYWAVLAWFVAIYLLFAVPFATFYYEADTTLALPPLPTAAAADKQQRRRSLWRNALTQTLVAVGVTLVILVVLYFLCRTVTLKVDAAFCAQWASRDLSKPLSDLCALLNASPGGGGGGSPPNNSNSTKKLHFTVDISVYLLAAMSFAGWFCFSIFGGIGLAALPLDAIAAFRSRPRPVSLAILREMRQQIGEKARKLRFIGEALRQEAMTLQETAGWKQLRRRRQLFADKNKYKKAVFDLENEYRCLVTSARDRGEDPFFAYLKLCGGCLALALSVLWIVHIVISCLVSQLFDVSMTQHPALGFLDAMLNAMAKHSLALLALLFYIFLVVYLLVCTVKGCFKFGAHVFCLIGIHPMKKDETHLNSVLFNVVLVLLSSASLAQFTAECFENYTQSTVAAWVFAVQTTVLPFFGFIFKYSLFVYLLLLCFLSTAAVGGLRMCLNRDRSLLQQPAPIGAYPSIAQQARAIAAVEKAGRREEMTPVGLQGAEDAGDTLFHKRSPRQSTRLGLHFSPAVLFRGGGGGRGSSSTAPATSVPPLAPATAAAGGKRGTAAAGGGSLAERRESLRSVLSVRSHTEETGRTKKGGAGGGMTASLSRRGESSGETRVRRVQFATCVRGDSCGDSEEEDISQRGEEEETGRRTARGDASQQPPTRKKWGKKKNNSSGVSSSLPPPPSILKTSSSSILKASASRDLN